MAHKRLRLLKELENLVKDRQLVQEEFPDEYLDFAFKGEDGNHRAYQKQETVPGCSGTMWDKKNERAYCLELCETVKESVDDPNVRFVPPNEIQVPVVELEKELSKIRAAEMKKSMAQKFVGVMNFFIERDMIRNVAQRADGSLTNSELEFTRHEETDPHRKRLRETIHKLQSRLVKANREIKET